MLADKCYQCHGEHPDEVEGGLDLTYKDGFRTGGGRGPALVVGNAADSLLVRALGYSDEDLQMPPSGKLPEAVIEDFRKWIELGAADPREQRLADSAGDAGRTWQAVLNERKKWWSFQPIEHVELPQVTHDDFSEHPVDRFIAARWEASGLQPAPLAEPRTLLRRLSYVLTGLPPTPDEFREFVAAAKVDQQAAVDAAVDRMLDSPRFGERWARHWMDWIRYAETHGSEGDPRIPNAWRYRDYLIRALNADVPYNQLVLEHLAGDRLDEPRINHDLGLNESAIGTSHYRFVQHGYSPTDALDEQVRFTENQIDVISKGFLGLTVACARCHNHKFDAISQSDFYALYGIMASSRPAVITIDSAERQEKNKKELAALKPQIREALSAAWLRAVDDMAAKLLDDEEEEGEEEEPEEEEPEEEEEFDDAAAANYREGKAWRTERDPLYVWRQLRELNGLEFRKAWESLAEEWRASKKRLTSLRTSANQAHWDLTGADVNKWHGHGSGFTAQPSPAGEFTIATDGDRVVNNILPAGMYSHTLSDKHSAVLSSPRFKANKSRVFVRVAGNMAVARYVVQNYPLVGETYPVTVLEETDWRWHEWDAGYWDGDHLHIEITTAADQPVHEEYYQDRSWFGIREAIVVEDGQPTPRDEIAYFISPLFEADDSKAPQDAAVLVQRYAATLRESIVAWREGTITDAQARFLDYFARNDFLPNDRGVSSTVARLLEKYRSLEDEISIPTRAPSVMECDSFDQPLFVRGNHRQPSDAVKRRFLEAIDGEAYRTTDAGRQDLAQSILDSNNPLTSRVIVNRLWHHTFGSGIVPTPDNFGQLGEQPTHPQLLDYLARRFVRDGWCIKKMLRLLTTSRTFQLRSIPSADSKIKDPANRLLSHASLHRLEAEAIRDSMLMAAGRLELEPFGEPVEGTDNRRSVYVRVRRNNPDSLLNLFDAPIPISTTGRRLETNVPAQALSLMNDEYVHGLAQSFATRVKEETSSPERRITRMFELALGRPALRAEIEKAKVFLDEASSPDFKRRNRNRIEPEILAIRNQIKTMLAEPYDEDIDPEEKQELLAEREERREELEEEIRKLTEIANERDAWYELALAVFCMKEFIYLR